VTASGRLRYSAAHQPAEEVSVKKLLLLLVLVVLGAAVARKVRSA
jgi:hypothetical protein